jgi:hypothetical protein
MVPEMAVDENGLEILERDACFELLRTEHLGRVGIVLDALPVILPIDYVIVDDQVVFRTVPGTKLAAATRNAVVAFEVDHEDPLGTERWSVLVVGVAHPMGLSEVADAVWRVGHLGPWADRTDTRPVGITADIVSGRRLRCTRQDQLRALA